MSAHAACPDEDTLSRHVQRARGGLPDVDVDEHIAACADCRELVFALACSTLGQSAAAPPRSSEPSTRLGRYQLEELLGSGAMGLVFAAFDAALQRRVAIKVLRRSPTAADAARLVAEAQALARLSHPNVVTVHDVGEEDGEVFLAMERLDGRPLDVWRAERARSWREVVEVVLAAGEGLAAAHRAGLIHRDVKPQNMLIGRDGRVCLTDFGLAAGSGSAGPSGATGDSDRGDAVVGTIAYMAPEQLAGRHADERSDVFSYCAALYEALYGRRPFGGRSVAELAAAMRDAAAPAIPRRPRLPGRLTGLLRRGLATDPARRIASMDEILPVLRGQLHRRRRVGVAAAVAAAALFGGAAWLAIPARDPDQPPCAGARERVAAIWNPERRAALVASLADGVAHREGIDWTLDNYATRWTAMHEETCQATHVARTLSGDLHDRRMICLDRRLRSLDAAVRAFTQAGSGSVSTRIAITEQLPSLDACGEPVALLAARPLPADPAVLATVRAVHQQVASADAAASDGRPREARAIASRAVELAGRLSYPPAQAEALDALGSIQHQLRELDAARASFARAAAATRAPGQAPIELIATGQEMPAELEVDGGEVFWIATSKGAMGPAAIRRTSKQGGGPVVDVQTRVLDVGILEVDRQRLYWARGAAVPGEGGLQSMARTGGEPVDLVDELRVFQIGLAGDDIYLATPDRGGQILVLPRSGGPPSILAEGLGSGLGNTPFFAFSGGNLFFTRSTFDVECDGRVSFVPLSGGPVTTVAERICLVGDIEADDRGVYWGDWERAASRGRVLGLAPPFAGPPAVLATTDTRPLMLALDDSHVYCATASAERPGSILEIPRSGGPQRVLAAGQLFPSSIAVDATHVYWTTLRDGAVKRIAR